MEFSIEDSKRVFDNLKNIIKNSEHYDSALNFAFVILLRDIFKDENLVSGRVTHTNFGRVALELVFDESDVIIHNRKLSEIDKNRLPYHVEKAETILKDEFEIPPDDIVPDMTIRDQHDNLSITAIIGRTPLEVNYNLDAHLYLVYLMRYYKSILPLSDEMPNVIGKLLAEVFNDCITEKNIERSLEDINKLRITVYNRFNALMITRILKKELPFGEENVQLTQDKYRVKYTIILKVGSKPYITYREWYQNKQQKKFSAIDEFLKLANKVQEDRNELRRNVQIKVDRSGKQAKIAKTFQKNLKDKKGGK